MPDNLTTCDIMAIGAHPDDIEFGCGGILAKMAASGKKIVMVDLTSGEKGTHGTLEVRQEEGHEAAKVIGAKRIFLDFKDCEVFDTYEGRLQIVEVIRTYKPSLILAPLWKGELNHPDHIATGLLTRAAFRYARLAKILDHLPTHQPDGILHYLYPTIESVDFILDISEYVETWKKMMACHSSQHKTLDFSSWNLVYASRLGHLIGKPYAQGLVKGAPVIIDNLMDISKTMRHI